MFRSNKINHYKVVCCAIISFLLCGYPKLIASSGVSAYSGSSYSGYEKAQRLYGMLSTKEYPQELRQRKQQAEQRQADLKRQVQQYEEQLIHLNSQKNVLEGEISRITRIIDETKREIKKEETNYGVRDKDFGIY